MGWGNKWEEEIDKAMKDALITGVGATIIYSGPNLFPEINHVELFVDVEPNTEQLIKAYAKVRNRKPTHDPYTNPNAHIYYECSCGAILDPQTKSFAALNNHASDKGWKIRFTDKGYVPYCVKCGEGVE